MVLTYQHGNATLIEHALSTCNWVHLEHGCSLEYILVLMASRALQQLGEKSFQPAKVGDIWHKAAISGKGLAKLRKQTLAEGRYQFTMPMIPVSAAVFFLHYCLLSAVSGSLIKTFQLGLLVFSER